MSIARIIRGYSSSSELERLAKCPPSATLERIGHETEAANEGNAGHEHFEDRAKLGVDAAMARISDIARKWFKNDDRAAAFFAARMRKLEWSPPRGSFGEVSLCMFEDGRVERTSGGKGYYPDLEPGGKQEGAIVAGQLDGIWSEPEPLDLTDPEHPRCPPGSILWVPDYKFGVADYVEPIETNLQLANNAMMAAKFAGATRVVPALVFMYPPRGEWDVPERDGDAYAWGPRELADAERRVRDVIKRRNAAIELARTGQIDGFVEGQHCTFCPGRHSCPAKIAMMRATAQLAKEKSGPVTVEELQWWAERIPQIEALVRSVREIMREHVDTTGDALDLGGGMVWGPKPPAPREKLLPHVALPILTAEFGEEKLDRFANVSKSAIEEVVKELHEAQGLKRQRSKHMGRLLGEIREAGGVKRELVVEYGAHRPSAKLPPADEAEIEGEFVAHDGEAAAQ